MKKFKLYYLKPEYFDFLSFFENELKQKYNRPYIGFIKINNINYLIPLTSSYENYQQYKYAKILKDENNEPTGALLINKMIPVIDDPHFIEYKTTLKHRNKQELAFLNQPHIYNEIIELTNEIYNIRVKIKPEDLESYIANIGFTIDFKTAEKLMYHFQKEVIKKRRCYLLKN